MVPEKGRKRLWCGGCGVCMYMYGTASYIDSCVTVITRMWANAQRDGRPAEYRWLSLFNAAKFG